MMRTLEDVHPDLYAERSRESVVAARERLVAALPPSMTRGELWLRLAPLVASFGDGHTGVYSPAKSWRACSDRALVFPPSVVEDNADHLVDLGASARQAPSSRQSDRIAQRDDADSLVRAWTDEVSGESEKLSRRQVARWFSQISAHSLDPSRRTRSRSSVPTVRDGTSCWRVRRGLTPRAPSDAVPTAGPRRPTSPTRNCRRASDT